MDHLRPGHGAHRSSSDRLLSNYLESQKLFTTSLLALLSQSHSSTSSLLAYVTSSPGVLLSVRRAVRHSAFEGPLSPSMLENPEAHMLGAEHEPPTPGWAGYIRGLDDFRKDLKQIHLLEEEMTRVKRDKEILVSRLIRQTKTRPTKSDLKEMAKHLSAEQMREYETMSSRASSLSLASDMTGVTAGPGGKESRRATKLKEAQAELLGCEEHLRALEVKIEDERNNVMYRGLEERFRAMEIVSQMWLNQARQGLEDLEKLPGRANGVANANNFELESNGSLAPSQSASQVGYDESGQSLGPAANVSPRRQMQQRHMQPMVGPGSITSVREENEGSSDDEPGQGTLVMHENVRRPASQSQPLASAPPMRDFNPPGGRRATSELGQPSRYARQQSPPLRRAMSSEMVRPHRAGSDSSSERTVTKRKGFFASIARFFKGSKHHDHSRRHGRSTSGSAWGKDARPAQQYGRRVRSDSSSDEDNMGNLVSVSNSMRGGGSANFAGWNAADVGKVPMKSASVKRTSSTPRARPASAAAHSSPRAAAASKASTVTPRPRPASAAGRAQTTATSTTVTRSNTVKSAPGGTKRASTITARSRSTQPGQSIMSIVDAPPPAMPDVPKAPQSQQGPMELVKAPGSSLAPGLVLPSQVMHHPRPSTQHRAEDDELGPNDSISRANSTKKKPARPPKSVERRKSLSDKKETSEKPVLREKEQKRSVSPLPPSKMRSPPLKSALRPTSPSSYPSQPLGPPPEITTLYDVHAPGPVQLPPDPEPERAPSTRSSRRMGSTDEASIYESANEDAATPRASMTLDDSSDDESVDAGAFQIINNERINPEDKDKSNAPLPPLPEDGLQRRKSVRLEVPDRENVAEYYQAEAEREAEERNVAHERELEKERARMYLVAANANASDDSLPTQRSTWDTRIGRMRDDTSDDDDDDPRYVKARRSLMSHTGDFKAKKDKKRLSTKSTGSKRRSWRS
ncbi:hypothetical protein CC85DRAFT_331165 [Cutaneotrichosporon oleaginosum]|uniref:Uncharacterized protein n=1 Tax=Cutaneotrichosporon oleaginosum TaxID=879819 RepID=A0A0J0XD12_9TREE|nr:uncharacterized protein CC85DRAFT_331165 [Cutaneotrichosporon oleaginosum]KLT38943.1 hypothetical protein CC85DRAFT_331165 [Cutaneotrichosporon oleaginosum]TXT07592.1 hypothetical protein COLE_04516 [Cutaneotrichosporon oleaginosum]